VFSSDGYQRQRGQSVGTVVEPERRTPIYLRTGVLVVGGGPAGVAAAVAAARAGADVTLIERYNHLGGLSTGGLVVWIDRMTDWSGKQIIGGLTEEIIARLPPSDVAGPPRAEWGSRDEATAAYWAMRTSAFHGVVTWSPTVNPEWLKTVCQELVLEAGVTLIHHAWVVAPLRGEGDRVDGVIIESKQGRLAVMADVVVDASGDADVVAAALQQAGGGDASATAIATATATAPAPAPATESDIDEGDIHHAINTSWLLGGVDMPGWLAFRRDDPQSYAQLMAQGRAEIGLFDKPFVSWRDDVALFMGPRRSGLSALNLEDLTQVEIDSRRLMVRHLEFYRSHAPGFRDAFLIHMAPQVGARHSRRVVGIKRMARDDWSRGVVHDDEVGISPSPALKFENVSVPYGCIVPRGLANVLAPGKHLSSDPSSHSFMREIPQCWLTGQAAGVAAAIGASSRSDLRTLDVRRLQRGLLEQRVLLRQTVTDR
jgi:hypothetical protein